MRWTREKHAEAVAAVRAARAFRPAAEALGISPGALREHFRKRGIRPRFAARPAPSPSADGPFARPGRERVYVVVSDVHVPFQCASANAAVCALMRDLRPDGLVVNGDFLDLLEVSRHSQASVAQLEGLRISRSFDEGNAQLDRYLEAAGPRCVDNHFVDGNHEDRLRRWIAAGDNAVWLGDEGVSIGKRLRFRERGIAWHEGYPTAHLKLGHLLVTHGRFCNKYAAATHLDRYGHSVLVGHVHVPQLHHGSALDKQKAGYVQGHLADPSSPAMRYAPVPSSWCQGFSVVVVEPRGAFHVQLVNFVDGAFYFGGRRYGRSPR